MKRIVILYILVFLATLLIPLLSLIKQEPPSSDELVTLFNGCMALFSY